MARVVALELVARAGRVQRVERVADVLEAVAEHEVVRALQHLRLPLVLERLVALEHREQAEVHRAHVERGDLRLPFLGRPHAFLDRHVRRAAGRQIDHDIGRLLDDCAGTARTPRGSGPAGRRPDCARADGRSPRRPRAAPSALSAISSAVTGRCGDIEGVWIEPVTAQLMMTFRLAMSFPPGFL